MQKMLLLLLLLPFASALTIQGTVYDFNLNPAPAIVEINTSPQQLMVTKDGTYTFQVPSGEYLLKARHTQIPAETSEEITAQREGRYTLDLILFPKLDEDLELQNPELEELENLALENPHATWPYWMGGIVVVLFGLYLLKKSLKHTPVGTLSNDLHPLLRFIEKSGGRTTQKDIRKQFNHSEAKISLMLDELEAKGVIQRIKKGRGNIVVKK
ncbi:MAG: hypothetical protein AABX70_03650 [Nanoarchaeota archaeon]